MPAGAENPDQEIVDEAFRQAHDAVQQAYELIEAAETLGGRSEYTVMAKTKLLESCVWLNKIFENRVFAEPTNGHGEMPH